MDEYIRGLGGNVTVFVPRDTAFEKLAEMKSTTVAELLEDSQYMEKVKLRNPLFCKIYADKEAASTTA